MSDEYDRVAQRWWLGEPGTRGQRLLSVIKKVRQDTRWRRQQDLKHMRLYGGKNYVNFFSNQTADLTATSDDRIRLNAIKAAVNTSQSYLSFNPRVMFLTDGGTQEDRVAAEQKQDAMDGLFYEADMNAKMRTWQFHALVFGTGFLYPYRDIETNTCKIDNVFPFEVSVSDREAAYGDPPCIFRTRWVDRMQAASKFKGHKKAILECAQVNDEEEDIGRNWELDQVLMHWAWRKATPTEAGRHTIILADGTVLWDKPTKRTKILHELTWTNAPAGYFGIGMVEEGAGLQTEINYLLQSIQRGLRVHGRSHWLAHTSAKLSGQQVGYDWTHLVKWSGSIQPTIFTPTVVPPEMYNHLWTLVDRLFSTLGVSAMAAMMMKPAGINSGRALRMWNDMQSQRVKDYIANRDDRTVGVGEGCVDICEEIAEAEGSYKVKVVGDDAFREVDWNDVKGTRHVIRPWPASQLSQQPSAKLEEVAELIQMGVAVSREDVIELLGWPDTKAFSKRIIASRQLVQKLLEKMVREGVAWSPLPQMNLREAADLATARYLQAVEEDVDEEKRDLLVEFVNECKALIKEQELEAQNGASAATPGIPPGAPAGAGPGGPGIPGTPNPGDGGPGLAGIPNAA